MGNNTQKDPFFRYNIWRVYLFYADNQEYLYMRIYGFYKIT